MGLRANPSIEVKDTNILLGMISLPVVYFRKVSSADVSNERMIFFKKSRHYLSASLLGLHSMALTTFLAVGVFTEKYSAMLSGVLKG